MSKTKRSHQRIGIRPSVLEAFLAETIKAKEPVLITGRPGIGKTDIVTEAARKAGAHLIVSHPVVSDPTDYKGFPFIDNNNEANFIPFGELRRLVEATELTVFFFDDLGQAPTSVQASIMQLVLARSLNGHKISDHVVFIGATNRREDQAAVSGMLEPLKSRFSIVHLEPTHEDWENWALRNGEFPIELIGAARYKKEWIEQWEANSEIENSPCPRNLVKCASFMKMPNHLRKQGFISRMGPGAGSELASFVEIYGQLPTMEEIERAPNKVPVMDEPSKQYAIITALTKHVNKKNISSVVTYVERYPKEHQTMFMQYMVRNEELTHTKEFSKWANENAHILGVK